MKGMHIHTESVGNHFGTVGVFRATGGREAVSDVMPYGFDGAARKGAYDAAVKAGLVREIGEIDELSERVRNAVSRAGAMILLDRYVVVDASDPHSDDLIASRVEWELKAVR
jgi:hypothetical protein